MQAPGYIDGHTVNGWRPEILEQHIRAYWQAGYQIHVHVTGVLVWNSRWIFCRRCRTNDRDLITGSRLSTSDSDQNRFGSSLGAQVSANVYYLHELSDSYSQTIGFERASQMARLGSCFRTGINTAIHSVMAPAEPLNSMWVAVNRRNHVGNIMGEPESLSRPTCGHDQRGSCLGYARDHRKYTGG